MLGITWFPLENGRGGKGLAWIFDRSAMERHSHGSGTSEMPLCHLRGQLGTSKELSSYKVGTKVSQTKLGLCYRQLPYKQLLGVDVLFASSVVLLSPVLCYLPRSGFSRSWAMCVCVFVFVCHSQGLLMVDLEGVRALSFWDYPVPVTLLARCSLLQKKAGFLI